MNHANFMTFAHLGNDAIISKRATFTQVSNDILDDDNISPQAFYVYSKICRYINIPNFTVTKKYIQSKSNMSEKTFEKYWKELYNEGYIKVFQAPDLNNKGKWLTQYVLNDVPEVDTPYYTLFKADGTPSRVLMPKPKAVAVEKPQKDYKKLYGNVLGMVQEAKEKAQANSKNTAPAKIGEAVKGTTAKIGVQNNTYINNTNISNTNISSSSKEEIEEDVCKKISSKCMKNNLKLSTKQVTKLMNLYDNMEVLRAIDSAIEAIQEGTEVKAAYGYVKRIIENAKKPSVTNIHIDKTKKPGFNNFTQREKTQEEYKELEDELLSWYDK